MKLSVRAREVAVLEQEELDFPETSEVDSERVVLGPIASFRYSDAERGPRRAVDFHRVVEPRTSVVAGSYSDEVGADRVGYPFGLMVPYAEEHGSGLRDIELRWIAASGPARSEEIELGEHLLGSRC